MNPEELQRLKTRVAEIGAAFNNLGPEALLRIALEQERDVQLQQIGDKLEALLIEFQDFNRSK
jgi:hypothetical protein